MRRGRAGSVLIAGALVAVAAPAALAAALALDRSGSAETGSAPMRPRGLAEPPEPAFAVPAPAPLHDSSVSFWAPVRRPALARAAPRPDARVVVRLGTRTPEGTANLVLVLERRKTAGKLWVRVRLAVLPNGSTGWVERAALGGYGVVRARLVVELGRLRATLIRDGRAVFRARVGIGHEGMADADGGVLRAQQADALREPLLRAARVRYERTVGGAHRLARGRLRRHPRHEPPRAPARPRLPRLHPHAERGHPATRAPHAGGNARDGPGMSARPYAAALALLSALAVAAPAPGQTRTEPLRELWSEYPLNPEPKEGRTGAAKDERLPLRAPGGPAPRAVEPPAEDAEIPLGLVLGASLGALALLVLVATVRRAPAPPAEDVSTPRPVKAVPAEAVPSPSPGRAAVDYEVCVVCRWRGYVKSQFCAVVVSPDGYERVFARSFEFRWWKEEPPPPSGDALAAYRALVRLLLAEGWEPEGGDEAREPWEETTFRRPLAPSLEELADELAGEPRRSGSAG